NIVLTVKSGFTINNGNNAISSNSFEIPINYIVNEPLDPSKVTIKLSQILENGYKDHAIISKLFNGDGITYGNLLNMNITLITIIENLTYQIELTPNDGFNINGEKDKILSQQFTLKFIEETIEWRTSNELLILELSTLTDSNIMTKTFLEKFFILGNRTQAWINETLIVTWEPTKGKDDMYTIILTSKDMDVKLNGENTFASTDFKAITRLIIHTIKPNPESVTSVDLNEENLSSITTLSKFFTLDKSLTQEIINAGLSVEIEPLGFESKIRISIKAKKGYMIFMDNKYISVASSKLFNNVDDDVVMNFIVINNPTDKITNSDFNNLKSVQVLSKLFEGVEEKHLDWIDVSLRPSGNEYIIILRAKSGYSFSDGVLVIQTSFPEPTE
ncbi:MAG: hypothetical protein ACRC63_02465, partial [Metamycoplasmataceae bacterium]